MRSVNARHVCDPQAATGLDGVGLRSSNSRKSSRKFRSADAFCLTIVRPFCTVSLRNRYGTGVNVMARKRNRVPAVGYVRTSSAANVGADKDSDKRQRAAIAAFAKRAGFALMDEFTDAAVSGADPIETRPGFSALLDRIEGNGVRTVIVEDASRFARELVTQELGILALIKRGVRVLTSNGDDLTDSSDPSRKMMRQIAGSFAEYEKARLVAKLKAARDRKKAETGKCGGRRSYAESKPDLVALAKQLKRELPRPSLRDISGALFDRGYATPLGKPYSASAVQSMLG